MDHGQNAPEQNAIMPLRLNVTFIFNKDWT